MLRQLLFAILLGLLLSAPASAIQILYPADGTYVSRSDALVIKAGAGVDGIVLEFGGEKSDLIDISAAEYRATFKDMLILQPSFDPGKNTIRAFGYRQGEKIAEAEVTFYYWADRTSAPPEGYRPFVMHTPQHEAACVGCHNLNPQQADLDNPSSQQNPCVGCHRGLLRPEWVHGPAGAFECGSCHDVQNANGRFRERKINAALCNQCHQDIVEKYLSAKYVHGPVAVGLCNLCHDSHGTPYQGQLVAKTNELCLGCHEGIDKGVHVVRGISGRAHPLKGKKDPSRKGRELSCVGCHNPHGGNSPYFFQRGVTSRMQLCQVCHKK